MASSDLSERLKALQDRDKGLRESRERHTDITTARAVVGTCNDMCPEVERFWREETKQVSPLEMDSDGRPDHHAMVKEYRRAGADQSEPLAHELRPGPVLERTMDYLLCNIMDKPESNPEVIEEWYDFLWSRTRAIRKDITQQHFCDLSSVALLEKCTRFHIHCAATLVEQDAAIFTPKINDENLSKCLQSLKDFYHDLSVKNNQKCPNEAEFRGYEILLKLRDDNVLREIKNLDPDIRDSDAVTFASDAYFAFNSRNYVRFFELVNSTTYLNACLLHRYFLPVRVSALKLMRRAYTATVKAIENYSVESFCAQLAFDDTKQAETFLTHFDLQIAEDYVLLTRDSGEQTENSPPVVRSRTLVEGKRKGISVGQIVNGAPLPDNPYKKYPLHSSFDNSGSLKIDESKPAQVKNQSSTQPSIFNPPVTNQIFGPSSSQFSFKGLLNQNAGKPPEYIFTPIESIKPVTEESPKPQVDVDKELTGVADQEVDRLMADVVKSELKRMIRSATRDELEDRASNSLSDLILDNSIQIFQRQIIERVMKDAMEEAAVAKKRSLTMKTAESLSDLLIEEVIAFEVSNICKDVHSQLFQEYQDIESQKIFKFLITQVIESMAIEVVKECYTNAMNERNRLIQLQVERRQSKLAKKYFKIWLSKYRKNKRSRTIKETFPACSFSGTPKIIVSENRPVTRSSSRRKLISPECENVVKQAKVTKIGSRKRPSPSSLPHISKVSALNELVSVKDNPDPAARLKYLQLQVEEQKIASQRMSEVVDVISKSFTVIDELEAQKQSE